MNLIASMAMAGWMQTSFGRRRPKLVRKALRALDRHPVPSALQQQLMDGLFEKLEQSGSAGDALRAFRHSLQKLPSPFWLSWLDVLSFGLIYLGLYQGVLLHILLPAILDMEMTPVVFSSRMMAECLIFCMFFKLSASAFLLYPSPKSWIFCGLCAAAGIGLMAAAGTLSAAALLNIAVSPAVFSVLCLVGGGGLSVWQYLRYRPYKEDSGSRN